MTGKLSTASLIVCLLVLSAHFVGGQQPIGQQTPTYRIRAALPGAQTTHVRWFVDDRAVGDTPVSALANGVVSAPSEVMAALNFGVHEVEVAAVNGGHVSPMAEPLSVQAPAPPKNLRIELVVDAPSKEFCGDGIDNDRDGQIDEGCVAVPPATGGVHAYFDSLSARPDLFAAYSMRDSAQVNSLRGGTHADYAYIYANDPYPKKQDAMRIRIRQGEASPDGKIHVDVGPSKDANMLFVYDFWMSAEWDTTKSELQGHKNDSPVSFVLQNAPGGTWFGTQISYRNARQHEHNQPAGGPYVAMLFPHLNIAGVTKTPTWWRDSMTGYPRAHLPYNAPAKERRNYSEAVQPFDTSVSAAGAEFGLVAERWTRIWHYFERVPAEDWVSDDPKWVGEQMHAYKWTMWFADTEREPVRMMDGAIVGVPDSFGRDHFVQANMGFGSGNTNKPAKKVVRGDLTAYTRNWVVLHGTPKAGVLTLLQKPAK
jgi:hypothetical protein